VRVKICVRVVDSDVSLQLDVHSVVISELNHVSLVTVLFTFPE